MLLGLRLKEEQTVCGSKLGLSWTRPVWSCQDWRNHDNLYYWDTEIQWLAKKDLLMILLVSLNVLSYLIYISDKTSDRNKLSCSCYVVYVEGMHRKAQGLNGSANVTLTQLDFKAHSFDHCLARSPRGSGMSCK